MVDVDSNGGGGVPPTTVADVEKTRPHSASPALPHSAHVTGPSDLDHDLNLDLGRALFGSAVVFSGFALAVALVWLGAPLFGYKLCAILGTCGADAGDDGVLGSGLGSGNGSGIGGGGNGEDGVIVNGGEDASSFFPFSVGFRHNQPYGGYRKRSMKSVGPLLRTLSSAYERYEEAATTTTTTPKVE